MFARVTVFEGGDVSAVRGAADEIKSSDAPPPEIPAKGITMLVDPESGKTLTVVLFETEEDRAKGDATPTSGRRPATAAIAPRSASTRSSSTAASRAASARATPTGPG
jgi:hypothetical protein